MTKLHWLCQLDHKILKLSRAVGCGLAIEVKNFMVFRALVLDTVKMTHSVIVKVLSYYSCKFNCTFPKQNWALELALPPNGNVRDLFLIASLKSNCFLPDFIFSGKSQTNKRRPFFIFPSSISICSDCSLHRSILTSSHKCTSQFTIYATTDWANHWGNGWKSWHWWSELFWLEE